ncbi:MAG TPA: hypothetical protein VEH84_19355 [Alphaproteobacteria bacterium]|nr:hypothetical protein [Alphaproteobacteria bacterium]
MDWLTPLTGIAITTCAAAAVVLAWVVLDLRRRLRQAMAELASRQEGGLKRMAEHAAALQKQNRDLAQRVATLEAAYRHVVAEMQGRDARDDNERPPGRLLN